ncbi:MAG: DUF3305 domain-containing protein [Rhodospirillales bacterium]|nr:DUF3305 domain-containing protein [Rhodospirillales bacterium]
MTQATDKMTVGVVVERRDLDNKWVDHAWRAVAVIPGAPPVSEWRQTIAGDGWTQYHAATLDIEIFAKETDGYRANLQGHMPVVYVVLRPNEGTESPHEVDVFHVTVCAHEASLYAEMPDNIVDGVPMPPEIVAWVSDFFNKHHVEVPFVKRKRLPYDPRKGGPRGDGARGGKNE